MTRKLGVHDTRSHASTSRTARETQILAVNELTQQDEAIERAAAVVRAGGLVAFPTETVYGLGADATSATAVAGIFTAKGRPAENPLIVHVASVAAARELCIDWPREAELLAARFWPGPLSIVLPKRQIIPDLVTAGRDTVALRMPASNVALALIRAAAAPIAAPSANRTNHVSPTRAEHVQADLDGRIDLVLDGGPCSGGIESTVLDLSGAISGAGPPSVLRPGLISAEQISATIQCDVAAAANESLPTTSTITPDACSPLGLPSPGMLPRHYAPSVPVDCIAKDELDHVAALLDESNRVGWLTFGESSVPRRNGLLVIEMPEEANGYARRIYAALRELEESGVDRIVVSMPPCEPPWRAVRDRLQRASASA